MTNNEQAFSTMIGMSEGTVLSPLTQNFGYDVIVSGIDVLGHLTREIFTDYSDHPFRHRDPKVINTKGLKSTAAGKHQILLHWWDAYVPILHLPDFSAASQELYYMQQMREHRALQLLGVNNWYGALQAISGLWASLPGKAYVGQSQHTIAQVLKFYQDAGGITSPFTVQGVTPPTFPPIVTPSQMGAL